MVPKIAMILCPNCCFIVLRFDLRCNCHDRYAQIAVPHAVKIPSFFSTLNTFVSPYTTKIVNVITTAMMTNTFGPAFAISTRFNRIPSKMIPKRATSYSQSSFLLSHREELQLRRAKPSQLE